MAEVKSTDSAPVVVSTGGSSFIKRNLNGATFLSLEHLGHMILVVVVTGLIASGVLAAISLWGGQNNPVFTSLGLSSGMAYGDGFGLRAMEANAAIGIVGALVVLLPLLVLLDRRTRAEWLKRKGYASRLAYKLPVYGALAVLITVKTMAVIQMVTVVLSSLAQVGVAGANIGDMYLTQFLPSLLVAALFGGAGWYVLMLAKGRDGGRTFSGMVAVLGTVLAVALFITSLAVFHEAISAAEHENNSNNRSPSMYDDLYDSKSLEDIFRN